MTTRPPRMPDRHLRAFLAAAGYPDPAAATQERTIWAATEHRTPTSRICSASSTMRQAPTVIDPEILKAVQTVYSTDLILPEEWTDTQRDEFLTAEATMMTEMATGMAETLWEQAITVWSKARNGQTPSHETKVALLKAARQQAVNTVLNNELYELIATEQETPPPLLPLDEVIANATEEIEALPTDDSIVARSQVCWEQRWTKPRYQSEPSPDVKALIDRLWPAPDFSAGFRIKAGYLLAARAEDGLMPPADQEDPATAELAQMIYRDLRADGLPER